jgi:uncharacterized membrane protein
MDQFSFRHRAREVSRIEAFSDVVFGFALTLIVVSLEVPKTYEELMHVLKGVPAFAICFATLMWIWYEHHKFFKRYAMHDGVTITLNAALLFVVLFYTYPLKFIFAMATRAIPSSGNGIRIFTIYGIGFIGTFALLFILFFRAWSHRRRLQLTEFEVHDTVTSLMMYSAWISVGLFSIALANFGPRNLVGLAGWSYFLLGPISAFLGYRRGTARHDLQRRHVQAAQTMPNSNATADVPTVATNGPNLSEATPAPRLETAIDSVTKP